MTLIDRLSKLDGPDREVDAAIWMHLIEKPGINDKIDRDMVGRYPSYTASVDAAIALAERVLPKHTGGFQPGIEGKTWATIYYVSPVEVYEVSKARATTPAIALCIALLRAKEASDEPLR